MFELRRLVERHLKGGWERDGDRGRCLLKPGLVIGFDAVWAPKDRQLDVVLLVSFILNDFSIYYPEANAMEIYLSNMNQDSSLDVLDIVMLVDFILNP